MIARTKSQVKTVEALELVFAERIRQNAKHGDAMLHLPDGTGPNVRWLLPLTARRADIIQESFRDEYDNLRATPGGQYGQLTRMHLVREEIAEAFELDGDDPHIVDELIQVAALCVQWVEYKLAAGEVQVKVSQES